MPNVKFTLVPVDYSKPYDEQPECKRHVIGAYANLARHNMTLVVNTIMQAIGMDTINENSIGNAFGPKHRKQLLQLDNIKKVQLQKRLYRHFVFLKRMKLEDEEKKSVQLEKILEVLYDFTSCMSKIRNFYTHYHPYNSPKEVEKDISLKESMGKSLTYLFENSCQTLKKRDKLSHEDNEVFATQREEVRYAYYWYVPQNLPQNLTIEQLKRELLQSPSRKRRFGQTEYTLLGDGCISGLCRVHGMKHRYTWNFSDKRADGKTYNELLDEIKEEIKKKQDEFEKNLKKNVYVSPVPNDTVRIDNTKYFLKEEKGIVAKWTQFDRDPAYYAAMSSSEKGLSDVGLIYFLCLFLDKSVAFKMLEEVGFTAQCTFTNKNAGENIDILQELMCMNRIRMVKAKLDSEMTETALGLDMINELRKCPKELYSVLGKDARNEFNDETTVYWEEEHRTEAEKKAIRAEASHEECEEDESFLIEESIESIMDDDEQESAAEKNVPKSTLVRWEDRFPQMALRYIDMTGMFSDIRFQLNLGKYRFAFYQHNAEYSVDNQERLRILQKEMHGFGRIQEVSEEIKERWKDVFEKKTVEDGLTIKAPDEVGQDPYITEQYPQYAINRKSHSIGLRWEGWNNDNRQNNIDGQALRQHAELDRKKMFIPYLPNPQTIQETVKQKNNAERLLMPQCTLSLYELPALLFYRYLLEKYDEGNKSMAETRIKKYYDDLKAFLSDVGQGNLSPDDFAAVNEQAARNNLANYLRKHYNGLRLSDIPEKIRKYLLNIATDYYLKLKESAYRRLQERKIKVENALESYCTKFKRIGTKENKFDSMRATIKTGALGQALIRDIMDWLPNGSIARQRLTGQSYVALQSALSMLGQFFENENGKLKGVSLTELKNMMVKAGIINNTIDNRNSFHFHPFLHLIFNDTNIKTIEKFYESYLQREIKYISNTIDFLDKANGSYSLLSTRYRFVPFLHHDRERWSEPDAKAMQKMAVEYLNRPLQLPDGLFTQQILGLLKTIPKGNVNDKNWNEFKNGIEKALEETDPTKRLANNASYLINLYFNLVEGDHSQPFYITNPIADDIPSPYLHEYKVFKKFYGETIPNTNKKTTPAYTVEKLREMLQNKDSINSKIETYVNKEVAKYRKQKERDFKRKNRKYEEELWDELKEQTKQRKRKWNTEEFRKEVEQKLNEKKAELEQTIEQYRIGLTKKQERMFKKVNDNERAIRRYKTQDILLLIMARNLLRAQNQEGEVNSNFQLKYVMTDSLLDQPIDFQWKVRLKTKDGSNQSKVIEQKGMKMKDYGQFYKFASDHQRLESLLSRLPDDVFKRAHIENEFSYYDSNRSEVFRQVYIIEAEAYKLRPELGDDDNASEEWFYYLDKKTGKLQPIRNSFIKLLEILAAGKDRILNNEEKVALQATRNAFGHNTYNVDLETVFKGKKEKKKIPEIANGIRDKIEEQTKALKDSLTE